MYKIFFLSRICLSPINQRRLHQFKSHRRGYYSFWLFLIIILITTFAEFIASDKPLIVYYEEKFYFPIFKNYNETTFGGTFETAASYQDSLIKQSINKGGWMIFPPIPYGISTVNYELVTPAPAPPSPSNWLGTDDQGRDILARLIYSLRTSIYFGMILTFSAVLIGVLIGACQGYFGGKVDLIGQRLVEVWNGLPVLYLLIILSSMIEPNFWWLLGITAFFSWMPLVGVVRAEFLKSRNLDYVKAAEALGVPSLRIIGRHILPNAMVAVITYIPFILNGSIAMLTSLDFLGFGLPPGSASLGELIIQAKNNIQAPWIGLTAFFAIATLLSLLIFIGEGLRSAFDPKKFRG